MDGAPLPFAATLGPAALSRLMPMYLALSASGIVTGAGPTLEKLFGGQSLTGRGFFECFDLRRPGGVRDMAGLMATAGQLLRLHPNDRPDEALRGTAVPMAGQGLLLNLSFGRSVIDAVRRHNLTLADFAATDLTIELLFLAEAKAVVMSQLQGLTLRLQGARDAAEERALTDMLTGLRNRRAADAAIEALIAARRPFGLMHMDLDFFKAVNDSFGHAAGDHVLREVAAVLRSQTRAEDVVARIGGDEFMLVFPGLTDPGRLVQVAGRVIAGIARPMPFGDNICQVAASIGINISTRYVAPSLALMAQDADAALYAAKYMGRGRSMLAPLMGIPPAD